MASALLHLAATGDCEGFKRVFFPSEYVQRCVLEYLVEAEHLKAGAFLPATKTRALMPSCSLLRGNLFEQLVKYRLKR